MTGRPSSRSQLVKWLAGGLVAVALVTGAERALRALVSKSLPELRGAQWIWAQGLNPEDGPVAFYLVRDFHSPGRSRGGRLFVQADEEYVVTLNEVVVGSNRFDEGAPVDVYDIGTLVRPGRNRLLVELRSSRGVGGLLLALEARGPEGTARTVTDGAWSTLRGHRRILAEPDTVLGRTEPVEVWGSPPVGRWGYLTLGDGMPVLAKLRGRRRALSAARALVGREAEEWSSLEPLRRDSPSLNNPWVTFDWGREVTGYLGFRYRSGRTPVGLVFVGKKPPYPEGERADAYLIALPGRRSWTDTEPRTFRYATLIGVESVVGARIFLSDPRASAPFLAPEDRFRGVFGIERPPLRPPLENKIWSELQSVAGAGVGKTG